MGKRMTKLFLTLTGIFGLTQASATESYPFFLEHQDGGVLEGYFCPPSTIDAPIIFAIQSSGCKSALKWSEGLSDHASALGFGVIVIENCKGLLAISDLVRSNQMNSLEQRQKDYELCLKSIHSIAPAWEGKFVFWGESEGGVLAANLAVQESKTAAVLLFATDGGMKPREEVSCACQSYLEGQTVSIWDEQGNNESRVLDSRYLEAPTLGAEQLVMPLSEQSLLVCLIHGVEDNQIPVESVDLMAEALAKTNSLTYLRLEGYGHDLATPDVQVAAFRWLDSVLSQQEILVDSHVQVGADRFLSKERQMGSSDYILCRDSEDRESGMQGRGDVSVGAGGEKDSDGNERAWGDVRYSRDFGNGVSVEGSASGSLSKDRDGNIKGEGKVEGRVSIGF